MKFHTLFVNQYNQIWSSKFQIKEDSRKLRNGNNYKCKKNLPLIFFCLKLKSEIQIQNSTYIFKITRKSFLKRSAVIGVQHFVREKSKVVSNFTRIKSSPSFSKACVGRGNMNCDPCHAAVGREPVRYFTSIQFYCLEFPRAAQLNPTNVEFVPN